MIKKNDRSTLGQNLNDFVVCYKLGYLSNRDQYRAHDLNIDNYKISI